MPLIRCPECKKQISDTAESCVHCGFKIAPDVLENIKRKQQTSDGVISLIVILIGAYFVYSIYFKDFTPSDLDAQTACQGFVKDRLKSPSTADFSAEKVSKLGENKFQVQGVVDAQNSFGGIARNSYLCQVSIDSKTKTANLVNLLLNPRQ